MAVTPKFAPSAKPIPKFFASCRHSDTVYEGTLSEILETLEDNNDDPDDYVYYPKGEPVKVKFVKKLVLEVDDGNS